jgi:tetratricopeptide (TPR) repeat protein
VLRRFRGAILAAIALLVVCYSAFDQVPARVTIDYPGPDSLFPPDISAPTFLWRDASPSAAVWHIDVTFADGSPAIHVIAAGERMRVGEIDPRCVSPTNELPKLTPQQAATRTWKPDDGTWSAVKQRSAANSATITISGYSAGATGRPVSSGRVAIQTSKDDPVGAPIFYRDVPLMPSELEKGVIKPLAPSAVPLIAWRLRNVSETRSRVLLEDMHTCANCHSFSLDGKTLGMDLDGPQNDKGLYTIVPIQPKMSIRNEDVISWTSFRGEFGSQLREGFMSQVSPDGRYVVTTIKPSGTSGQLYYVANFKDYRFLQVFYPTSGILVWYNRTTGKLQPLPGADDPRYAHTNAVWSPDGRYLVFARAVARDPYPENGKMAEYANDPNEVPMQYDLYRIPFGEGKGGTAEPVAGASRDGLSNSFPKISPDGRWIVFVKSRNGLLMRPDSQLYIVPAAGGQARRMRSNTPLMNSWHSFSPNGRWLVFSSKSRSPYTQMFLTHLDESGNDTPAILVENATAANRAVNLPEFVNIPPDGMLRIDAPAAEFYRQFDVAAELAKKGRYDAAIPEWQKALEMSPDDARAHNNFGLSLVGAGKTEEGIAHYRKALEVKPDYAEAHNNLAIALAESGRLDEAIVHYQKAVESNPGSAEAQNNLGEALAEKGRFDEAIRRFEGALAIRPAYAEAHNNLAIALAERGRLDEAVAHYERALQIKPDYGAAHNNLGAALARKGRYDEAIAQFEKALALQPGFADAHRNLGRAWLAKQKPGEAIPHFEEALAAGGESAELHNDLGTALAESGRVDDAIPHFERAVSLNFQGADAQTNLARALVAKRRFAEAIPQLEKALKTSPESAELHNELGLALANQNRLGDAVPHFEKAIEIAPDLAQARYYLGAALKMRGQIAKTLTQWREALRAAPDNVLVLNETAWLLATSAEASVRSGSEAVGLAEKAVRLTGGSEPEIVATLAAAYAEAGRFEEAVEAEGRAADLAAHQGNARLAEALRARIELFRQKRPMREPR